MKKALLNYIQRFASSHKIRKGKDTFALPQVSDTALTLVLDMLRRSADTEGLYRLADKTICHGDAVAGFEFVTLASFRMTELAKATAALARKLGRSCPSISDQSDIESIFAGSAEAQAVYNQYEALRNNVVHNCSLNLNRIEPAAPANNTEADSACFTVYFYALLLTRVTASKPLKANFSYRFRAMRNDISYTFSNIGRGIGCIFGCIRAVFVTFCRGIGLVFSHTLSFGAIAAFITVASIIAGAVLWCIVALVQDDYNLRKTDPAEISHIVASVTDYQRAKAIEKRHLALYALGKDYRVGDPVLDSLDARTFHLYNMAVAEQLPSTKGLTGFVHRMIPTGRVKLPGETEKFAYLLADERRPADRITNHADRHLWQGHVALNLDNRPEGEIIYNLLKSCPSLGLKVVYGTDFDIIARNKHTTPAALKAKFRKTLGEDVAKAGIRASRISFADDPAQTAYVKIYLTGIPPRKHFTTTTNQ